MWHTQSGDRVLRGAEGQLFREAISYFWDMVEDAEPDDAFGIGAFDRLTKEQKVFVLAEVGSALLDESIPSPDLTAVNEATIALIYRSLIPLIYTELDDPENYHPSPSTRSLVLSAYNEVEGERLKECDLADHRDWADLVHSLENGVLWEDGDFEMDDVFLDLPAEEAEWRKKSLGIDPEYFVVVPSDPSESELAALRQRLAHLTGRHYNPEGNSGSNPSS